MPETFRVLRELLNRIDDPETGTCCSELQTKIPPHVHKEAELIAKQYGDSLYKVYEMHDGVNCMD